eukprot:969742-Pyramimonas_sp.AAC.1
MVRWVSISQLTRTKSDSWLATRAASCMQPDPRRRTSERASITFCTRSSKSYAWPVAAWVGSPSAR